MIDVKQLILDVYSGKRTTDSLTDEESLLVIGGLHQVAEFLADSENHSELSKMIIGILNEEVQDPFEESIIEAETRGSVYWELENSTLH